MAKKERSDATKIDADWVLKKAVELFQRCMQEIRPALDPKSGKQLKDEEGHVLFKFNAAAANRALEIIGKHVEVAAFKDRLEVSGEKSLIERIRAAKEQAFQPALDRLSEDSASD